MCSAECRSPRDGKEIRSLALISALHSVYNISYTLAAILTIGAYVNVGHLAQSGPKLSPDALLHSFIVHKASLVVDDAPDMGVKADTALLQDVLKHASGAHGLTLADIARIRIEREAREAKPLETLHATIAEASPRCCSP